MTTRLAIGAAVLAWASACAGVEPALKAELSDVRAEVKALREENARLARRVERVEIDLAVRKASGKSPAPSGKPASAAPASGEIPSLTVVKLKPKVEPPPPLNTSVPVVEPPADVLEALASAPARGDGLASTTGDDDGPSEDPALADGEFDQGLQALRTGNVEGGVDKLKQFARDHPRHARADNALYFASVGMIGLGDLEGAAATLEAMLREYPAGDAVSDGMLKLAECRTRQSRARDAKTLYSEVIQRYPGTAAASQAEQKLAQLLRSP
ncbi:MAG TPA: tetratricopeptide repeat protein [Myxococcaceae bacterium]|nr:tetratricopeptide repeat protein [Myxococcaceae bacterium]